MASAQGSTGVDQDRGMCKEKRNDDRPEEGGTLNSGRRMAPDVGEIYLQRPNDFQPTEGVAKSHQESDLPIVVRDGKTDHTAKGQAGMQRGQSTHARGRNTLDESVSRTLSALGTKAGKEPGHRFRGLARLLDRQLLGEAFSKLKRKAAPGIDGVFHAEYAKNLEENLLALESRLKQGSYRARPVKRRWIAKAGSNKMRPLGIPVLEDKIVQQAVRMILEPIWENDFVDESIGYRPGRSPRRATQELGEALHDGKHRWVVEADIRGFFDHINHDWLIKMLEERIADRSLIRIIRKWLKAGVMEELRQWSPSYEGTPQGGIISPLLGNIYLHFVQDLWIKKDIAKKSKGSVLFRRYADDSIVCFERKDDAEAYLRALPERLAKFGLQLAEEKSALVKFNRWEGDSSGKFTFVLSDLRDGFASSGWRYSAHGQSWLRLLLGEKPAQSEILAGEAHHQREEVPRRTRGAQRLAQEIAKRSASRDRRHAQAQAARLLELLRCDRQFRTPLGLRMERQAVSSQVAQPPQPAAQLQLDHV